MIKSETAFSIQPDSGGCCLVSDIPPCSNYSGGIFIDHMLRSLGGQIRAAFILLNQALTPELSPLAASMQMEILVKPIEKSPPGTPPRSVRISELEAQKRISSEILTQLLNFAARFKLKSFWVLLEGQSMIRLAYELMRNTDLPVFVQVMDPPRNWFRAHAVDPDSERELLAMYEAVLRAAPCCAAASWRMADAYTKQFGVPCVPVVPSLPEWHARLPMPRTRESKIFRIGIAGQLYADDEWNRLLRVLRSRDWKIGRTQMEVHAFTQHRVDTAGDRAGKVIKRDWLTDTQNLIGALAEMDLLYMPYRFGAEHQEEASFCFPSKLTTYFASGKPVLIHGPAYSSPIWFAREHRAGFCSTAPEDSDLLNAVALSVCDWKQSNQVSVNGRRAFDEHLTYKSLASSIRRVLSATGVKPALDTK